VGIVHDLGKIRGNEMLVASRMALEMGELKEQGYASLGGTERQSPMLFHRIHSSSLGF
jgi:hypothetical protein